MGTNGRSYFSIEELVQQDLIRLHEYKSQAANKVSPPSEGSGNEKNPAVKLPKIVLPKFDGDYLKWGQFRGLFKELVHNQSITNGQKVWYLKTSLTGDAEKLIKHLSTSEANYTAAWKIINDRYENSRLLVNALINKLLSQPNINTESSSAIKSIHDTTQECLLALENLGVPTAQWDPLILFILVKKLDKTTHTLWEQSLTQPRSLQPLSSFLKFLETRSQSLEALGAKGKTADERKPHTSKSLATTNGGLSCHWLTQPDAIDLTPQIC